MFKFGVTGAGIYYGLSIGIWFAVIYYFVGGKRSVFQIKASDIKLEPKLCLQIIKVGTPPLFLPRLQARVHHRGQQPAGRPGSSLDIAAFAVINGYVVYIIMMVVQAITFGVQPIAAYNAGARPTAASRSSSRPRSWSRSVSWLRPHGRLVVRRPPRVPAVRRRSRARDGFRRRHAHRHPARPPFGWSSQVISSYFRVRREGRHRNRSRHRPLHRVHVPRCTCSGGMMGVEGVVGAAVADVLTFVLTLAFVAVRR